MHIRRRARKLLGMEDEGLTLIEQIERFTTQSSTTQTHFFDVQDDDVLGYVEDLLRECLQIRRLEKSNLTTREEALRALELVEHTHRSTSSYSKAARALRSLLETVPLEAHQ